MRRRPWRRVDGYRPAARSRWPSGLLACRTAPSPWGADRRCRSRARARPGAARAPSAGRRPAPRRRSVAGAPPRCRRAGARPPSAPPAAAAAGPGGWCAAGGPAAPARRGSHIRRAPRARARPRVSGARSLAEDHRVDPPVARPAGVVLLVTEGQLLAVADGRDALGGDALSHQVVLHGLRPLGPQRQVVLDGAAAVAVPLELDLGAAVAPQPVEVAGQRVTGARVELVAVVPEVNVLQDAVLLGREPPLAPLEARAARSEALLAQARAARAGLARPGALLLAGARERKDEQQCQRHAPHARRSHADRLPRPPVRTAQSSRGDQAGEVSSPAPRVNCFCVLPSRSARKRCARPARVEEKTR